MKCKEELEEENELGEEVDFWLGYIRNLEARYIEPIPDRAQLLLENALLKLEGHYPDSKQALDLRSNEHTLH